MKIVNTVFNLKTKCKFDFIDLTDKVKSFIKKNRIKNGFINIQSLHTTATVFVNEREPLLLEDFKNHLEKLSPQESDYNHDDFERRTVNLCNDECKNGHSHCKAIHLPVNIALNLINSEIQLGQWQRILFVELDRPKKRKVQVQIMGI
jgi:secondary thiamine-phosphate synthase enzyme